MHRALQKVLLPLGLFVCAAPLWAAQTADEGLTKSVPCAACHQDLTKNYFMSRHGVTADSRTPGKNMFNMSRRNAAAYVEPDERKASVYV